MRRIDGPSSAVTENPRQATLSGASRIAKSMIFIATANSDRHRRIKLPPTSAGSDATAIPTNRLKTMNASSPPPVCFGLKALTASLSGLVGIRFSSASVRPAFCCACATSFAAAPPYCATSSARFSGGRRLPGFSAPTRPMPMPTLIVANTTVTSRQRPPALPSFLMSPISATPSTIAAKISGMTTMKMMRRNTLPIGCVTFWTTQRTPGDGPATSSVTRPAAAPTTRPAMIRVASGQRRGFSFMSAPLPDRSSTLPLRGARVTLF